MSDTTTPIMIAPNGARRTKEDHRAIPVTIDQTIQCALDCKSAGAHALHAHVRTQQQKHLLDANAYSELINQASTVLGEDFPIQVTTEAFGIYSTEEQITLVKTLKPRFASMAVREIIRSDDDVKAAGAFYQWCWDQRIGVQHILYSADELDMFFNYQQRGVIPADQDAIIMVVGRYTESVVADTNACAVVVDKLSKTTLPWMLCAFGHTETACLTQAAAAGGGVRVGFENNIENAEGRIASNNAERVQVVSEAISALGAQGLNDNVQHNSIYRLLGGH